MTESIYQQDLGFLYEKLLRHPLFVMCPETMNEFNRLYGTMEGIERYGEFIDAMTRLTAFFAMVIQILNCPIHKKICA